MVALRLSDALKTLPSAESIVIISAGDLGTARIFPPPIRPLFTNVNQEYHAAFAKAAATNDATYVDLSKGPGVELFEKEPNRYFAKDQFHLSGEGYGLWFDAIKEALPK